MCSIDVQREPPREGLIEKHFPVSNAQYNFGGFVLAVARATGNNRNSKLVKINHVAFLPKDCTQLWIATNTAITHSNDSWDDMF